MDSIWVPDSRYAASGMTAGFEENEMSALYFEDLSVGQSADLTRTVDEAAIQAFADG